MSCVKHPGYNSQSSNLVNDLALIELTRTVTLSSSVSLVCVNKLLDIVAGQPFWAIGWGQISENKASNSTFV